MWHGELAADWIGDYDRDEPFFLFVGFPGPHDPWDAPAEAVARYDGVDMPMPASTRRPDLDGTGRYGRLIQALLDLSDSDTMTDDAIRAMRRAYNAAVTLIDDAVGRILDALDARGLLDDTWVVYTSDHGEMGGDHSLLSKCLLYEPTVRVPLDRAPAGWRASRGSSTTSSSTSTCPPPCGRSRERRRCEGSDGRSLLGYLDGDDPEPREVSISENWAFASFETDRYRLVVDEDRSSRASSSTSSTIPPRTPTAWPIPSARRSSTSSWTATCDRSSRPRRRAPTPTPSPDHP